MTPREKLGYKLHDERLNEFDVVLHPTEVIDLMEGVKHQNTEEARIELVQTPSGKWLVGVSITVGTAGMGYAPAICHNQWSGLTVYDTRRDAIDKAVQTMTPYITRHPHRDTIQANIEQALDPVRQLELF